MESLKLSIKGAVASIGIEQNCTLTKRLAPSPNRTVMLFDSLAQVIGKAACCPEMPPISKETIYFTGRKQGRKVSAPNSRPARNFPMQGGGGKFFKDREWEYVTELPFSYHVWRHDSY